ncbi:uncharacterized protein LOC134836106 isoform X2 [Culicoides brevitarsis]
MHNVGETILIGVLNCIESLSRRLESEAIEKFYRQENATIVGQIIYITLEKLQRDSALDLRISAVNCLKGILQVHDEFDTTDIVLRANVADVVFKMTPRVFVVLSNLFESDAKMSQKLRARVLEAFGRILCLIFEDPNGDMEMHDVTQTDFLELLNPQSIDNTKTKAIMSSESSKRTDEWKTNAIGKLAPLFNRLLNLMSVNYGILVTEQLKKTSLLVTLKCARNFHKQILPFYEILLANNSNSDDWDDFRYRSNLLRDSNELMIFGLNRQLRQFSRIINRKNEQQLLISLKVLKGYMEFFKKTFILTNSDMVDRIFDNLLLLFEIEYPSVCLEEVVEWNDMNLSVNKNRLPWRNYKYLSDESLLGAANQLIGSLSSLMPILINKSFDRLVAHSNSSNTLICVVLQMLHTKTDATDLLVEQILEHFLHNDHWSLEIHQSSETDASVEELHFNVIHVCLVTELISTCSNYLRSNFEKYIFDALPKILEKVSSPNVLVHSAALHGLEIMCNGLHVKNVETLIKNNVNFITHYIEINLRKENVNPSLNMANALLQLYYDYDNFYFTQGLFAKINNIFHKKSVSDAAVTAALKVTLILLKKLRQPRKMGDYNEIAAEEKLDSDEILEKWLMILNPPDTPRYDPKDSEFDFEKMRQEMNSINAETEMEEDTIDETEIETTENVFLRDLIKSLIRFTSSSNVLHKLYSLDAIGHCLNLLDAENKEFLPTIHLIWAPLASRFKENNLLVISRTFDLLLDITRLSKDFVQKRTSTDVLPGIMDFLHRSMAENLTNTGSFASSLTQSFKLQQKIFDDIGNVFQYLDIHERLLDNLLDICIKFLKSDQPKLLKNSCWKLMEKLYSYDSTAVILKLRLIEEYL